MNPADPRVIAFIKREIMRIMESYIGRHPDDYVRQALQHDLVDFLVHWTTTERQDIHLEYHDVRSLTDVRIVNPTFSREVCPKINGPFNRFDMDDGLIHASCFLNTERARLCDLVLTPYGSVKSREPITCLECLLTPEVIAQWQ